jgi:predicted Zn-ribbon and HTH transcriptional regulator
VAAVVFRRQLIDMLAEQPRSVSSIARELGLKRGDVEDDFHHLIRSARAAGHLVHIEPARCRICGFVFDDRRLAKPSKCPACRGSRILEAQISLTRR